MAQAMRNNVHRVQWDRLAPAVRAQIAQAMALAMRRQAGKIRFQNGVQNADGTGWGLSHIEANHGDQIRNAGFESVQHFVSHVARNFNEVLQAKNRQLLVAIDGGRQDVMFVQLEPEEGGDFYRINTAFPASRNYLEKQQKKGMKLLWGGSEPAPAAAGQQPPYAGAPAEESGQGAPIARGQSSDASLAPAEQKAKNEGRAVAVGGTGNATVDQSSAQKAESTQPAAKIEDFGEKLGGARKDVWGGFKDDLNAVSDEDIASQPLSKVWPAPDYDKMIEGGTPAEVVATIRALRDEIPAKPRQAWKVLRWADQVKTLREFANEIIDGKITLAEMRKMAGNTRALEQVFGRVDLYMAAGHAKSLQGVRLSFHHYTLYKGQENVSLWAVEQDAKATAWSNWPREIATGKTKEEAIAAFKSRYESLDTNAPASRQTTFEIYSQRGEKGYWVGKKIGRNPVLLEGPFEDIKAARAYKDENHDKLVEKLEKAKAIPSERRDTNEPRVGVDMRNGQDVTPELFAETFGFRGVEFGNWVEGSKRQKDLNEAFDALMDMAAILNVPPKALSLNGELGLAFGARGKGGINPAKAHYEPGYVVINLTKKDGAGSLGHEWWHALDNYFSRMRGKGGDMMTEALDVSLASRGSPFVEDAKVRKQMIEAFGNVVKAINLTALRARSAKLDERRAKAYWTTGPEMSARAFESFLISKLQDQNASNDYLANIVDEKTWQAAESLGFELDGSYPYPTAGEVPAIRAAFDEFFATVQTRETEKGVALFSRVQEDSALATTARPISRAALDGVIERVTAQWKGDGQASVTVVARFDDLPAPILRAAEKQGYDNNDKNDRVLGVAFNGRVYLVQENITSEVEAEETLLHERVHQALRGDAGDVASKNLRAALTQLYRKMGGGEGFLKIANQAGVNLKGLRRQVASTSVSERAALATEELLAEIEGRRAYERLPDKARRVLGEFVGFVRTWLRENGFGKIAARFGVNLDAATLSDLRYMLKGLRDHAPGAGSGAVRFMRSDGQVTADAEIRALVAQYANEGAVPSEAEIAAAVRQYQETEAAYGGREAFERAKAAGKTKLNYHQWVQVRTPNFKRWFGDWEAIADLTISRQVASKKEAELSIAALAKRDLRNLETGINAQINSTQAKKLISNAAVDKSIANGFTREQHYAIAANIEALWRHAVQVYEGPDTQNDDPKVRIKRFAVPVMIGSDARYATIMAKETIEHGHRVYTLEAHGEKTLRGMLDTLNSETGISSTPARSVDSIVASLDSKVNPDTVSKVTDPETGEPMVVYHGTLADFNAFDRGAESNFRYGEAENSGGIFFGTSPESVEYYLEGRRGFERGANILPAFVSIRNPASIDDAPRSLAEQARLLHDAEAAGHDGALIGDQVIAFAPGQAKSATGNQGTFDGSNPDIRFSFAGRTAQTADQYALAAAQRRIAMGENAETVRQDTGWHRGDDGKWRFEISDDQARVAVGGANAAEIYDAALLDGEVVRVADVLDHPQLFAAYPHLADVRIELLPAATRAQARYQHSEHTGAGLLQINPRVKREAMVKTLLHELQHGIQFREGFAQGGSPDAFASDSQEQGADTYRRLAGEVEARNVETRRQMTPDQRRAIAPGYTSDTMPGDVLVTFNGKRIVTPPHNATSRMPMTESGLLRAVRRQFPGLAGNVEVMLARGRQGEKGGLVMLDSADPLQIARVFAEKTGRTLDEAVEMFSKEDGSINGFYDPKSGLTFMAGPNTDPVTAPAVLLHEAVHGQQRKKIDAQAMDMLTNRAKEQNADTRAFLDRVAQRMIEAGVATDSKEAAPYIVEQAVIEGRSAGYKMADSKFFAWADRTFGKKIGDFLRSVVAGLRTWMIWHGGIKALTVDDLVGYAMVGVERAARGAVDGKSKSVSASEGRGKKSVFTPDAYDAQQFASAVDRIAAAENAPRTDLTVGDTPAVLRVLGAKALPIQMPSSMIHKASRPAIRGHDVPVAVLRNLPALIADPVMVFDSRTEHGAMVALVDARDDSGRPVVVAVHMDAKGGGFHNINKIASIYGKDDIADIERWMAGSLRYYQKEKAPRWLRAVGLQLPEANTIKRLNSRVITDADIVNRPDVSFSRSGATPPRTADAFPELNADQRAFLNKVGTPPAQVRASEWVKARFERIGTKIRQGLVDRYAALKEMDEKLHGKDFIDTAITDSAWVLARMSSAASGAMSAMMTGGRVELDGAQRVLKMKEGDASGGLMAVLQKLGPPAEVERFFAWVAANRSDAIVKRNERAVQRTAEAKRELENIKQMQGVSGKTAEQVSELAKARKAWEKVIAEEAPFIDVTERLFTANEIAAGKALNAGKTEGGAVRPALYAQVFREFQQYRDDVLAIAEQTGIISAENRAMWRDEFYVPFYRVMEDDGPAGPHASKGLSRQEAYKKLKGGRENLNDLLENTLMNFHHLLSASMKNQAAAQTVKNAEKLGIARVVPESRRDPKNSTFVLANGERVFYEIDDPMVFEALTALSDGGLNNFAVRAMSAFKRVFTNMTTLTPQFIIANTLRDLMQATATTPTSKNIARNLMQGAGAYRDPRTRAEMLASGGAFSFGHIYGADVNEVKANLRRAVKGAELVTSPKMIPAILKKGWDAWSKVTDTSENLSRAATYVQNVEEKGRLRAAFEARDIMDFSQHGAWPAVRFLTRVVPFLNARLQGLDKIYRSGVKPAMLTAMGKGSDSDRVAAARFGVVTGALTLATIALYLANYEDDEYQKLEEWQKDTYWFFRIGDNAFFLPKPFEVGAIATMAERMAQQALDDKATGKLFAERMKEMFMQTFAFNPVPQMFQPALDIYSNKDAFTGRDIETVGMERLSPGLRARDSTTAPARALSAASRVFGDKTPLALSPVQADHLIRGYLGSVGATAAATLDTLYRTATGQEAPDKRWSEYQPISDEGCGGEYPPWPGGACQGSHRENERSSRDVPQRARLGGFRVGQRRKGQAVRQDQGGDGPGAHLRGATAQGRHAPRGCRRPDERDCDGDCARAGSQAGRKRADHNGGRRAQRNGSRPDETSREQRVVAIWMEGKPRCARCRFRCDRGYSPRAYDGPARGWSGVRFQCSRRALCGQRWHPLQPQRFAKNH